MELLFLYLALALAVSFLCSISEAVILSVSSSFINMQISEGKRSAKLLKVLKENIDRPLSAILSVNTVAHTVGAAGVGAQAVAVFGEVYFGLISAILTILILIFSEIIPKTIGAIHWRKLAGPVARTIRIMIIISYPLVILSDFITKLIAKDKKAPSMSREEIAALANLGKEEGILDESESKVISNLIRLKSIKISSIMTPRTVMIAANQDMKLEDYVKDTKYLKNSRIPVYNKTIDDITGYVLNGDVLEEISKGESKEVLKDIKRPVMIVSEKIVIPDLFEKLLLKKEHLAIVTTEFGGTEGLVTMEDIIETILGLEIVDEKDIESDMRKLAKKRWEIKMKGQEDK